MIPSTDFKRFLSKSILSGERTFVKIPMKERTGVREKHLPRALSNRLLTFLLPVPGGVLLTISVLHTAQDQNKGDQL